MTMAPRSSPAFRVPFSSRHQDFFQNPEADDFPRSGHRSNWDADKIEGHSSPGKASSKESAFAATVGGVLVVAK